MPSASKTAQKSSAKAAPQSAFRKWGKLVVIALAVAIIIIDTTLLNVSLRNIVEDLNSNFTDIQWVITLYTLVLSAFTITGGRLGDLYGRKKMFMLGAVLFAIGSFVASISHNIGMLLVGESIVEGIGAALMMPAAASLILTNYEGKDRAVAFAIFGAIAGASSALGPILGGWLTSSFSWRWGFRINIAVVIVLLIGSVLIKESRDLGEKKELDLVGVGLTSVGLLSLVFGIIESSSYGWWRALKPWTLGSFTFDFFGLSITPVAIGLGLLLLGIFVWDQLRREAKGHTPLVSMRMFKNRQFVSGMLVNTALSLTMTGLIFVFPIYYQSVHGLDAFHTGLSLFPLSLTVFIISPLSLFIARKARPKTMIIAGLVLTSLALLTMIFMLKPDSPASVLLPGLVLFGAGMGLIFSQVNNLALSAVSADLAGEASGVNNTMRQVGASFGAAIIGAALFTSIAGTITANIQSDIQIPDRVKPQIIEQAKTAAQDGGMSSNSDKQELPQEVKTLLQNAPASQRTMIIDTYQRQQQKISAAVKTDVKNGITESIKNTLWIAFGFSVLSIVAGFSIPNIESMMKDGPAKAPTVH